MVKVDARGDQCPIPVIKTKKAISALGGADTVEVLVDNEIAVQNVSKMAASLGAKASAEKLSDQEFRIRIEVSEAAKTASAADDKAPDCVTDSRGDFVVVVSSDRMTAAGRIAREGEYLKDADFTINEDETFLKISGAIRGRFEKAGYELLRYSEAEADACGKPETEDILTLLIARGQIVKLPGDFLIDAGALEKATEAVREKLRGDGSAAVSEIRDLLGTSRKNVMANGRILTQNC